ncbi:MAG: tetratricopeptide repeat protein [Kiritimatiellae bacterium]|nr:tetratricopeptide repeat protein [Kiritimatiellia bacterium]
MIDPDTSASPTGPWISGWEWSPPAAARGERPGPRFHAMNQPGSVGPDSEPPGWSLHLECPEEIGPASSVLYACGFLLRFARDPAAAAAVYVAEPGLLCGRLGPRLAPTLFCAASEIRTAGPMTWLEANGQHVALIQEPAGPGTRFCLAVETQAGHAEAAERARRGLELKFEDLFAAERASRAPFWADRNPRGLDPAIGHVAVEFLFARLRPPQGALPFRWMAQDPAGPPQFSLRHLYPMVLAWSAVDPAVAEDLVKCALSCQQPDGRIPAWVSPESSGENAPAALPLVAQAAEQAWRARREPGFPDFAAPRLRRYLRWACRHYDPAQTGPPCWQSADEALVPDTFDAGLASPDLAAFLLCEIEAYLHLARACVTTAGDEATWQAEIQRLKDALQNTLWDERRGVFTSRYIKGAVIERPTLSALLPIRVPGLRAEQRLAILQALRDPAAFGGPAGAPAWAHWEGDPEPPPVQALYQVLLLEALRRAGAEDERRALARTLSATVADLYGESGRLPDRLDEPDGAPRHATPAAVALAVLLSAPRAEESAAAQPVSPFVALLDRYRSVILSGAVGLLALGLTTVAVLFLSKTAPPEGTLSAWTGLATRYHQEGRYDEAQELYEKILASGRRLPTVELLLANTLLKRGELEEAENRYRRLVAAPDAHPIASLNFAVALYLRGHTNEAFLAFQAFAEKYDERHPQLVSRARAAMQLLAPGSDPASATGLPAGPGE